MEEQPETIWRGLRYWVGEPKGSQHLGWNNWFVPYTVVKKTAKRVTLRGDLDSFIAFSEATGYPSGDKADIEIDRAKFEKEFKVYHSRLHEWFYKIKPKIDPERPRLSDIIFGFSPDSLAALGLRAGATKADIKRAYKRLARKAHPDGGGSHEAFMKLNQAYEQAMRFV